MKSFILLLKTEDSQLQIFMLFFNHFGYVMYAFNKAAADNGANK